MKRFIFILIQCCYTLLCSAASPSIETDSLENLLPAMPHDSTRLILLRTLTRIQQATPDCIRYSDMLLKESLTQSNSKFAGTAIYFQLIYYYNQNELDSVNKKLSEMELYVSKGNLWDYYFDSQRCQIDLYSYREQFERAINKSFDMYKRAQEVQNVRGLIGANQCLANAYMGSGRMEEGKKALEEAHKLLPKIDNIAVSNSVLCQLISLSKANNNYPDMEKYLNELHANLSKFIKNNPNMLDAFKDPLLFAEVYYAYYYTFNKQPQMALRYLQKGKEYLNPHTYFMYRVLYHDAFAGYYRLTKEYNSTISHLDTTIALLKDAFNSDYIAQLSTKADVLVEAGRAQEALPIYEYVFQRKDSLVTEISDKQMQLIQESYHMDKMVLDEQILKNKIQLVALAIIAIALLVLMFIMIHVYRVRRALKKAESETRKATRIAEEANETKNRFLSNMSYNIRIPLNGVVGFSQLIASEPNMDEKNRREYSAIIQKNTEELMRLVNDVLDLSRLEANMMKFQIQQYDVILLCNDVLYMADMRNNGTIAINYSTDIQTQNITTDTGRLIQALVSLLIYPQKCDEQRTINFTVTKEDETKLIHFHIENSPLADPRFTSQEVDIHHEINRLLIEHFKGNYSISTNEEGLPFVDLTYPFD